MSAVAVDMTAEDRARANARYRALVRLAGDYPERYAELYRAELDHEQGMARIAEVTE